MARRTPPIARIRLARSLPRLLAWPVVVILTGAMAIGSWFLGSFGSGVGGLVFAAIGGVLVLVGLVVALVLLSVRLDVHEAAVRLSWLGGERIYPLVRGPVTRVRLIGEGASRLRPRIGFFGWAIGAARLRDEEEIHIVRLARTPSAILVPTEHGRLAIAPSAEEELLDALSRAARARQRLEEVAAVPPPPPPERQPAPEPEPRMTAPPVEAEAEEAEPVAAAVEVEPRIMTGIERAMLEQRLADERAAAEQAAAEAALATDAAQQEVDTEPDDVAPSPEAARGRGFVLGRPRPSAAFVLLPLLGAGAAWGIGVVTGSYPPPGTDDGRLTALALVLAGPATSVGAIMARAWWPRLVGIVVGGGLVASVFIARGLLA